MFQAVSDPMQSMFLTYGPGIKSFFALLNKLVKVYLFLSAIAVAQMSILYFYNNNNMNQDYRAKLTFGGFPYSRPIC